MNMKKIPSKNLIHQYLNRFFMVHLGGGGFGLLLFDPLLNVGGIKKLFSPLSSGKKVIQKHHPKKKCQCKRAPKKELDLATHPTWRWAVISNFRNAKESGASVKKGSSPPITHTHAYMHAHHTHTAHSPQKVRPPDQPAGMPTTGRTASSPSHPSAPATHLFPNWTGYRALADSCLAPSPRRGAGI